MSAAAPPTSPAPPLLEALSNHTPKTGLKTIQQCVLLFYVAKLQAPIQLHTLTFNWWIPVVLESADDAVEQVWPGGLLRGQVSWPKVGSQV